MKPSFDIFFLSYDEDNADSNHSRLAARFPSVQRIHGVKGLYQAHKTCSDKASTEMYFVVDGDNHVADDFNFDYQPPPSERDAVHVWRCRNPVNDLIYGYGAIKLFPKGAFQEILGSSMNKPDMTTSVSTKYKIMPSVASTTRYNTSALQAWRSAFRECTKLASQCVDRQKSGETLERLNIWCETAREDEPFAQWVLLGAKQGRQFGERYRDDPQRLSRINDFSWLSLAFARAQTLMKLTNPAATLVASDLPKTFCILPWIHLSTRPNGHMRVCCTANASSVGATNDKIWGGEVGIVRGENGRPANLNHATLLEGWNNSYMRGIRTKMIDGEIPPSCTKCFKEEASGHRSKRNWETQYWLSRLNFSELMADMDLEGGVPPKLQYIDLRLGTKCNLKCIMCSPHDSSLWVADWKKVYPTIENPDLKEVMNWDNQGRNDGATYNWHQNNPVFWRQLYEQIPFMKQLYFAGGEATIIEEHYTLLEECVRRGEAHHIELRYNSNGVELPDRLFELWSHFQRVRFHYSIDSIEHMNSYIRYPANWENTVMQLRRLDETPPSVEVTIACAVQILNIFYIPDFIRWKLEQNFKKINAYPLGSGLINFHFVYHPPQLNVKVLPHWFKKMTKEKYEKFYEWLKANYRRDAEFLNNPYGIARLQGMINFMLSEDWSNRLPQFQEYIARMDDLRGLNFSATFPEMAPLLTHPSFVVKSEAVTVNSDDSRPCIPISIVSPIAKGPTPDGVPVKSISP